MSQDFPERFVITIGRSFGSGGRALGKIIAQKLGINFYDKMLLVRAAEKAGLQAEFLARNDEKPPSFMGSLTPFGMGFYNGTGSAGWLNDSSGWHSDRIYQVQDEIIREIAQTEACVIVGRTADYILRDHPHLVNIFVHAPIETCVDRILEREPHLSRQQAKALAEKTNKLRANFYNFYTDQRWGDSTSYDMCFDSSRLSLEDIADIVIEYARRRFRG